MAKNDAKSGALPIGGMVGGAALMGIGMLYKDNAMFIGGGSIAIASAGIMLADL